MARLTPLCQHPSVQLRVAVRVLIRAVTDEMGRGRVSLLELRQFLVRHSSSHSDDEDEETANRDKKKACVAGPLSVARPLGVAGPLSVAGPTS